MKIAVYTAILNNYDWLKDPVCPSLEIDYICFTDSETLKSKVWNIVRVDDNSLSPSLLNRKIKLLYPYTKLSQYDYTLYVDGSVMIKGDVSQFINKYITRQHILMNFKHPDSDCIFEEIEHCINERRGSIEKLKEQYDIYREDGMPMHYGLSDNKILLRKNCKEGHELMKDWYQHVCNFSGRDQVCLSYVLWKHKMKYYFFEEIIEKNVYFETWPHNNYPFYVIMWRKMKWYSERTGLGWWVFKFLNNHIKPIYLKLYVK